MTLTHISIFVLIALLSRLLSNKNLSTWVIMLSSLIFIYWLQPVSSIRSLEFWLPVMLVFLTLICWVIVTPKEKISEKENVISAGITTAIIIVISLLRYLNLGFLSSFINPPGIQQVFIYLLLAAGLLWFVNKFKDKGKLLAMLTIIGLIALFILLKHPLLTAQVSYFLRKINGQALSLANAREIAWVGYSYFAFKLIHVLREWQLGRNIDVSLPIFLTYTLYFPAFTAGPIERIERFQKEFENRGKNPLNEDILQGGSRIAKGLFYKFILADSLALISLNSTTAQQVNQPIWMWVIIYCYALRLYFDFCGYTDLAIGISRIIGIRLPENFNRPYQARNLTLFWNRWHITLTQWFRTYYFNPVTRYLRSNKKQISIGLIIFFTQITTMLLIGLWHGITINYVLWGLWNGLGMFVQNRWSEWKKTRVSTLEQNPVISKVLTGGSIFLTFNFIALGWVWFAMPNINDSLTVFSKLLGGI